jgi:NADP-dependent 3-hydroxy acid dehydrogenase YdfG
VQLKPVSEQVVVVMGASSGIGRATALRFAEEGAKVVVAARGKPGLRSLVTEIENGGGTATAVVADVADAVQVQAVADRAVAVCGRIDTWVQMAGVLLVAGFDDTTALLTEHAENTVRATGPAGRAAARCRLLGATGR